MNAVCFATRRCGRWIGVARVGADEHQTIAGYSTRLEALQAAREIAARLVAMRKIAAPDAAADHPHADAYDAQEVQL